MRKIAIAVTTVSFALLTSCGQQAKEVEKAVAEEVTTEQDEFAYLSEQFADLKIVRYQVPGWERLSPKQKELLYYLYEAAISGRDIMYDQNYKHNLTIRRSLEAILENFEGDTASSDYQELLTFTKRVWFSNGIHHHYGNEKMEPGFSQEFFKTQITALDGDKLPLSNGETQVELADRLATILFDPTVAAKKVSSDSESDLVVNSAVNFYEGVTQKEVETYFSQFKKEGNQPEHGLNSKMVKEDGKVVEKKWMIGGMYSPAIEKIVFWLEKAVEVAETPQQAETFKRLITYFQTGKVADWDQYNIAWVADTVASVDAVNGFIEVYNDPLGYKGSYESVVSFRDEEATKRIAAVGSQAQWFEDNSPLMPEHKKKDVVGITGKVITVVVEGGDASPSTPIGINLPNNNWIRQEHGSKSVNLGNIVHAYEMAAKEGKSALAEFAYNQEEIDRQKQYGSIADILHTDLHEVIGHASGVINDGIGTPKETLKSYASTLEEGRADLVALYFLPDAKLIEMGLVDSDEVGKAAYDDYIRNGMMLQLRRIKKGDVIEEAHMRNRQLVAGWAYEQGKADNVIEKKVKDGKTYFVINDYGKLRVLFGDLLRELQRIKSEGDYEAGKNLVETYGVQVDPELHQEVLDRYAALNQAAYGGFINPMLVPIKDEAGNITDVKVEYPTNFKDQMMFYGKNYSFLPHYN
jgi:dipeptidyl-peptidase-3